MKKIGQFLAIVLAIGFENLNAQVDQTVIAEHFTNTRCSVCASRNPALIKNFADNTQVIHISFHPSKPYSSCLLNKHNTSENDNRTKYYNVFGSTPQLLINGKLFSGNFASSTLFTPYLGKKTEVEITSTIEEKGTDSVKVTVKIVTKAAHSFSMEKLGVFLAEDTVFYNGPNGEKEHYNVFRKSLTAVTGDDFTPSTTVGTEKVVSYTAAKHADWEIKRMRVISIFQKTSDKSIIQSSQSNVIGNNPTSGINSNITNKSSFRIYPNPSNRMLYIGSSSSEAIDVKIFNSMGNLVVDSQVMNGEAIDIEFLKSGVYHVVSNINGTKEYAKLLKN